MTVNPNEPDAQAQGLPQPGHIFEGKYRIQKIIGAGGFAKVYLATFEDVKRDVAIKVLMPQAGPAGYAEELDQRFLREAQLISELRDPHTITMFDFGRSESGLLYMVFEFINGRPLDKVIRQEGALAPARVVRIVDQVLRSLREAHQIGILHRDIKPANLMVYEYMGELDHVKVLDFGIAKHWQEEAAARGGEDLTRDGILIGTPRYMSPEQICKQALTPASDIYALGLLTIEMLTGTRAIAHTEDTHIIRRHLGPEPFVLPDTVAVPSGLRDIVHKMTAKDAAHRYGTATEVIEALKGWEQDFGDDKTQVQTNAAAMQAFVQSPHTPAPQQPQTNPAMAQPSGFPTPNSSFGAPLSQAPGTQMGVEAGVARTFVDDGPTMATPNPVQQVAQHMQRAPAPMPAPNGVPNPAPAPSGSFGAPTGAPANQSGGFQSAPVPQSGGFPGASQSGGFPSAPSPSGGFPAAPNPSGGFPAAGAPNAPQVVPPVGAALQLAVSPQMLHLEVPMKMRQAWIQRAGIAGVVFILGGLLSYFLSLAGFVALMFCLLQLFQQRSLTIRPATGYEVGVSLMGIELGALKKAGATETVLGLRVEGGGDDAVLILGTQDGERKVAEGFHINECNWVMQQTNAWLQQMRGG